MESVIKYQLTINGDGLSINDELEPSFPQIKNIDKDLVAVYKSMEIEYPKFYKMDNLSKIAFLGVEILKEKINLTGYNDDEIALVFQNSYSSLDTDTVHQKNIDNKGASPAVFVYTLPNILMGEIAIRNKWFGENLFALTSSFDMTRWQASVDSLFTMNKAKAVIGGWVEVYEEQFELKLYFVEKN